MQTNVFAFSDLLIQGMKEERLRATQLDDIFREKGINITRRRLSEYYNNISTPPFEKAKEIVKVLNIDISDNELMESLRLNREKVRNLKYNVNHTGVESYTGSLENNIIKTFNVNLNGFIEGMTAELVEEKLKERVNLLYGETEKNEKVRYNRYIKDLIRRDLGMEDNVNEEK